MDENMTTPPKKAQNLTELLGQIKGYKMFRLVLSHHIKTYAERKERRLSIEQLLSQQSPRRVHIPRAVLFLHAHSKTLCH